MRRSDWIVIACLTILWVGLGYILGVAVTGGWAQAPPHYPADSAIIWISTGRLNNIRQASADMQSIPRVMEGMYEELIRQERRADSLEALIREVP